MNMTRAFFLSLASAGLLMLSVSCDAKAQATSQTKNIVPAETDLSGKSFHWLDLRQYVQDTHDVRVGMTRGELEKTYHMLTGLSDGRTWAYNHCPYVRIKVEFNYSNLLSFNLSDRVTSLGSPYWDDQRESPN